MPATPSFSVLTSLVLAVAALSVGGCARKNQSLDRPVSLDLVKWGGGLRENEDKLRSVGWRKSEAHDEMVTFVVRAEAIPEGLRGEDPAFGFSLTLYFQKDKLAAFRMNRHDTAAALDNFQRHLRQEYALGEPVVRTQRPVRRTPAGNETQDEILVFANSDLFVRIIRTQIKAADAKPGSTINEDAEVHVFSRKENAGLTPEALRAND